MTTKIKKPAAPRAPRKVPAKRVQTSRATGSLTRPETTKLVMQAQEAFYYQTVLGNIEPGDTFDSWRRDQVMDSVGRPGISKIGRSHWRTVYAHFLQLAGRDDEALAALLATGPKRDYGDPDDNHETSEALVAKIREALTIHSRASLPNGATHIHAGWMIACARQRTGKATLTLDTMAERLDPFTLVGLLSHLRNHIARREGRETDRRAARKYPCKPDAGKMYEDSADSGDPF